MPDLAYETILEQCENDNRIFTDRQCCSMVKALPENNSRHPSRRCGSAVPPATLPRREMRISRQAPRVGPRQPQPAGVISTFLTTASSPSPSTSAFASLFSVWQEHNLRHLLYRFSVWHRPVLIDVAPLRCGAVAGTRRLCISSMNKYNSMPNNKLRKRNGVADLLCVDVCRRY